MKMKWTLSVLFALLVMMSQAQTRQYGIADDERNRIKPLLVGDQASQIQQGSFNLFEELREGPVVLIFYRGYWCPYCTRHLEELEDELNEIRELGAQVVAITPENKEFIDKTVRKTDWSSTIIQDRDRSIMRDYGVYFKVARSYDKKIKTMLMTNIAENNGEDESFLPIPATYVIGQDQKVKFVHHDSNYKNRAPVSDILEVLRSLNTEGP